jgi:uncharacterized protein involved in cysteine biosynthesis
MNEEDRVCQEDLDATQAAVRRMYHRSMAAAVLGGLLFSVICALLTYFVPAGRSLNAAAVVGLLTWLLFGIPLAMHWRRHYRSIFRQLAQLQQRVLAGEVVNGSQVGFHRHAA